MIFWLHMSGIFFYLKESKTVVAKDNSNQNQGANRNSQIQKICTSTDINNK